MSILLTGHTGFLGGQVYTRLISAGLEVITIDRKWDTTKIVDLIESHNERIDCVIHAATVYDRGEFEIANLLNCNLRLPLYLLELCNKYKIQKFINFSSFTQYYKNYQFLPLYHKTKNDISEWMRTYATAHSDTQYYDLVLYHLYGPHDSDKKFIPWIANALGSGDREPIALTGGEQERDFIHVDDVVNLILILLKKDIQIKGYSKILVKSGEVSTIRSLVEKLAELSGSKRRCEFGALPYRQGEQFQLIDNQDDVVDIFKYWKATTSLESGLLSIIKSL